DAALVNLILNTEPAPLLQSNPALPPALVAVSARAMKKNPAERFASAEEMAGALERVAAQQSVALTNGETQGFMRELFGDEALDNPAVLTPSGAMSLPDSPDVATRTKSVTPLKPPRRRTALLALTGGMFAVIGAALGLWVLRPAPEPPVLPEASAVD